MLPVRNRNRAFRWRALATLVAVALGLSFGCDPGAYMCSSQCEGTFLCSDFDANTCPVNVGCHVGLTCECIASNCTQALHDQCVVRSSMSECAAVPGCAWQRDCVYEEHQCLQLDESTCGKISRCQWQRNCD